MGAGQERALDVAAHCDNNIHRRNVGQKLAVLGGFHINTVDLLHQPDSILIDMGFGFCTGRITFKHITRKFLAQGLSDLAAAGIVNTDKGYFFHFFPPMKGQRLPMH